MITPMETNETMRNFIFISPNFPETYSAFVKELALDGFRVLGLGDCPYSELNDESKTHLTEYQRVNLKNDEEVKRAVRRFIDRYGPIAYLESNNEYWLRLEARLRTEFNIEGLKTEDMDALQRKSLMKKAFLAAGAKVARYVLYTDKEALLAFIQEVGYPLFIKPDIGVGAAEGYVIGREEDIDDFLRRHDPKTIYICEQYVKGSLISFDGMADAESNVVFSDEEHFPPSIDEIVKMKKEVCYWCLPTVTPRLQELGERIVRAFGIRKRYFHIEFFHLDEDCPGLGQKGDYVALEANIRFPGGYTPDLIDYSQSTNIYKLWADVLAYGKSDLDLDKEKHYAVSSSRRDGRNYRYSGAEILAKYADKIRKHGRYPAILSDDLGNDFFMGVFKTLKDALAFNDDVIALKD